MRLCRKMHHSSRPMLGKQPRQQLGITDVAMYEAMLLTAFKRLQVGQVASVGQRIQVQHRLVVASAPLQNEIRTDEAGSACD